MKVSFMSSQVEDIFIKGPYVSSGGQPRYHVAHVASE